MCAQSGVILSSYKHMKKDNNNINEELCVHNLG